MPIKRKSGEAVCVGYLQDSAVSDTKSAMTQKFVDSAKIGTVKRTSEGYVTAYARAVRSGVQDYMGSELGLVDRGRIRVYRPPEEVFSADSLRTFSHAPITNNHPSELVDADNWRELAVGDVSTEAVRDGDFIALPLILKDAAAIRAIEGGKKELSAGYTAEIEFVDHADYDAVMRNIRINHLALVDKARAGSEARIGDSAANQWGAAPLTTAHEVPQMEMKAVAIGDKAVNVAATDADTLTKMIADKDSAIGELKAKLADAESKILSDAQIQDKAKAIADAMTRRAKVKAKLGDAADKMNDAQIEGALTVIDAMPATDDTARMAMGDAMKGKMSEEDDPWAKVNAKKKGAK